MKASREAVDPAGRLNADVALTSPRQDQDGSGQGQGFLAKSGTGHVRRVVTTTDVGDFDGTVPVET